MKLKPTWEGWVGDCYAERGVGGARVKVRAWTEEGAKRLAYRYLKPDNMLHVRVQKI